MQDSCLVLYYERTIMPKGQSGRYSVMQNLQRMETASKSQIVYMERLKELFAKGHPELVEYVEVMEAFFAQWLDLVDALRKQI